jgi:hypothetical protein
LRQHIHTAPPNSVWLMDPDAKLILCTRN